MTHSTQPPPYKVPRGLQGLTDKELETFYREMTRAVYLMWENQSGSTNDGVSSIVVGSNDWASAWAVDPQGRYMASPVPGGNQQREMAYRFGVNLVMYAFTGNYKADQVHIPAILERLGQ